MGAAYAVNDGAFGAGFSTLQSVCDVGVKLFGTKQCAIQLDSNYSFSAILWGDPPDAGASQQVTNPGI